MSQVPQMQEHTVELVVANREELAHDVVGWRSRTRPAPTCRTGIPARTSI